MLSIIISQGNTDLDIKPWEHYESFTFDLSCIEKGKWLLVLLCQEEPSSRIMLFFWDTSQIQPSFASAYSSCIMSHGENRSRWTRTELYMVFFVHWVGCKLPGFITLFHIDIWCSTKYYFIWKSLLQSRNRISSTQLLISTKVASISQINNPACWGMKVKHQWDDCRTQC